MGKKRVYILVEGRVQGVFFRATARDVARSLKVKGWVRNRWDGKVEMVVEGEEDAVNRMISWCHKGPPGAVVTGVKVERQDFKEEFDDFSIRY
ncbi:acylphosphatase [Candidatus Aerophobetes bacterium]|uniref:Acylphosphatase n=1 Tax=Aerophobetes bacterium TaxID=2030807 RepID=A0A662DGG2_UNCAE|nr:MAG: acylphosphatase [Candidatus Aerophobetes bacterium]